MLLNICPIKWGFLITMKKFNAFELIGVGVSIYLICLIFGAISKHIFGFDVDVLSASATLFAAVVAMILFNDWRDQFKVDTFIKLKENLQKIASQSEKNYSTFNLSISETVSNPIKLQEFGVNAENMGDSFEALIIELDFYERMLHKFKINENILSIKPNDFSQFLNDILVEFSKNFDRDNPLKGIVKHKKETESEWLDVLLKLKEFKIKSDEDIQKIILMLYDETL